MHGYSFNTWSDVVTYDEGFLQDWLNGPQTSMYYSLQVMGDVQDKSSAYAALDESEVTDYLEQLLYEPPEPQCGLPGMNPYEKLMARKRKWTPVQTTAGTCREGAEETIFRALALRHMELPVGDFISDALEKNVPDSARELLRSNVTDEENHDLALGYIANAYGVDEKAEREALQLQKSLDCAS